MLIEAKKKMNDVNIVFIRATIRQLSLYVKPAFQEDFCPPNIIISCVIISDANRDMILKMKDIYDSNLVIFKMK